MLSEFIAANHSAIVARSRQRVARRLAQTPTDEELDQGIPLFVHQLAGALRARTTDPAMDAGAASHGADLHRMRFTVAQVVHDYGDVCQTITELAIEQNAPITAAEFQLLNRCLDDAIAGAVTEYQRLRDRGHQDTAIERLGFFAHELRNKISAAMLAHRMLKQGQVAWGGSTAAILDRNLKGIHDLIGRSLTEVRVESGTQHVRRHAVRDLIEEVEAEGSIIAIEHQVSFSVTRVGEDVMVDTDRQLLAAALMNLLTNAFKFTRPSGQVRLRTFASDEQVVFEVEDECGGLPVADPQTLFVPWSQASTNRSGLGLGLPLVKRSVAALNGKLSVTDRPGAGCTFSITLPRAGSAAAAD